MILNISKRILPFFWMEQVSNLRNSSTHKLLPPFFPSKSKRHSWAKKFKKKTKLSFTTLLQPWNFQYIQLQMMNPSSSIPSNCPWMTIESSMEARYISYLTLSLAFFLCLLSIVYWLLASSFLLLLLLHFFLLFHYFIPMLDIRFLFFCNFTIAKLFNDCSRRVVFFWGYPLPTRCLIIVQDKK